MKTHPEYPPLAPYLTVDDAAKVIDFCKTAFDAEERYRLIDKASGKIGHAELLIRGQLVMLSDEFPGFCASPKTLGGVASQLCLMVPDTDAAYQRALAAGATSVRPPTDEFYGFRSCVIADPGGQRWMLQHEFEKVSPEEMQRRWDAMLEGGAECAEKNPSQT